MAITFTIDGENVLPWTSVPSIRIQEASAARGDNLSVKMMIPYSDLSDGSVVKPRPGNIARLTVDGTEEFEGPVMTVSDRFKNPVVMELDLDCADYTFLLDRKKVTKKFTSEESAGARIKAILQEFAPAFYGDGAGQVDQIEDGLNVPPEDYDYEAVSSILDRLCEATGYRWYVDFNLKVHFFAEVNYGSPLDDNLLDLDTEEQIGGVEIIEDISNLHNVVIVKDFSQKSDVKYTGDKFVADGQGSFFKLGYEPWSWESADFSAAVGGTPRIIADDPLDGSAETIEGTAGYAYICVAKGSPILMANGRSKPIEQVRAGELVYSHLGRAKQVRATMSRLYSGNLVELNFHGHFGAVKITEDHLVPVVRQTRCMKPDPRRLLKCDRKFPFPRTEIVEWVRAGSISVGDYLIQPVLQPAAAPPMPISREAARLIGYYLAEGFFEARPNGMRFAFHERETDYINDVVKIGKSEFGATSSVYDSKGRCVIVRLCSPSLHSLLSEFGSGASNKHIPPWVLSLDQDSLLEIVRGYLAGDGCQSQGKLLFSTVSSDLAEGIRFVLRALGCACRLHESLRNVFIEQSNREYLNRRLIRGEVTGQHAEQLTGLLNGGSPGRMHYRTKRLLQDSHYTYSAVTAVKHKEVENERVFNLDVFEDHSFLVHGNAVRNCLLNWGVRFPTVDLPAADEVVAFEYYYAVPNLVHTSFDIDSIREMSRREGANSDGEHHVMVSLPDYRVDVVDTLEFYAQMILREQAWPEIRGSFTTIQLSGWKSHQRFQITSDVRDIYDIPTWVKTGYKYKEPAWVGVSSVKKRIRTTRGGVMMETTVEFSSRMAR